MMWDIPERPLEPPSERRKTKAEIELDMLWNEPFFFGDVVDDAYDEWVDEQMEREWEG